MTGQQKAGSLILGKGLKKYKYSISGSPGALGDMLFTELFQRLPGTWYDHTGKVTQFRTNEAKLGMSSYADKGFRKSAKKISKNLKSPDKVDVDIHFEVRGEVENIKVSGLHKTLLFTFNFKKISADSTDFSFLYGPTHKVVSAIKQLR